MSQRIAKNHKKAIQLISVLIMGFAIWSYLPTLKFEFSLYDDQRILLEQTQLFEHGSIGQRVENIVLNSYPREEPLVVRDLSWLLDSVVFEPRNPFGYHFSNVLYHGLVLLLTFSLMVQLTGIRVASISLGIVVVLAVHVEPVAWIMGRKDILCALFCLLSVHSYLRYRQQAQKGLRILFYSATVVCSIAAYLSKVSAIILPILLALIALLDSIDVDAPDKVRFEGKNLIRITLEITPLLLLAFIVYGAYQAVLERYGVFNQAYVYSASDYLKVAFIINPLVLIEYLKMVVMPDNLSIYYNEPSIKTVFTWDRYVLAMSLLGLTGMAVWHMWRTNCRALLLLACFFVILLPYGNWQYFGFSYADRYLYLAVMFLIPALVSYLLPVFDQTKSRVIKFCLIMVLLAVIFNNYIYRQQHLPVWHNGETLWLNEINRPSASLRSYNSLTSYYISRAGYSTEPERAEWLKKARANNQEIFKKQIEKRDQAWLGVSYFHKGVITDDLFKQEKAFKQALDITPTYSAALRSLAICYFNLAQREQDSDKKMYYAQQSLQYFRRQFESPGTFSDSRKELHGVLSRLKTQFPDLIIPELDNKL